MDCIHRIKPSDWDNLVREKDYGIIDDNIKYFIFDFKAIVLKVKDKDFKKNIEFIVSQYRNEFKAYEQYFIDSVINNYDNSYYVYLFKNSKIIGMVRSGVRKDKAEISMVYLLPDYRGKGYAFKMMKIFINFLKKQDEIIKIGLSVEKENISALNLYKKLKLNTECEKEEELFENGIKIIYNMIYMSIICKQI